MTKPLLTCVLLIASLSGCALSGRQPFARKSDATIDRSISIARLSERHGNVQQARNMYVRLASEYPNHPVAHHRLGVMAAKAGNYPEALEHLNRARKAGGETPDLLCDIGYLHYLQNNHAAAQQHLRAAITANPQHKRAHNTLGLVLAEEGRFNESLDAFRRAVSEAEALSNLAYVQVQLGAFEEAEANYHRALAMNQSLKPAAEGLMHIAAMKGELKPVTSGDAREAIVHKSPSRASQNEHQQLADSRSQHERNQLASYGDAGSAVADNLANAAADSDRTVVLQASHQRTPGEEAHQLLDPRVGTTSRQIEMASAPQAPSVRNGERRTAAASAAEATGNLLPSRNPSWSPYQPLIP